VEYKFRIGNLLVGQGQPTFIIAEAGVNHDGEMKKARLLIDAARKSGADAVKFQSFVTERVIRRNAPKAKYQERNIGAGISQFDMLKKLELPKSRAAELKQYADSVGILFLSTAYDEIVIDDLEEIGVVAHKLASIEVVNHPLIRKAAKTGKPVILSVGMSNVIEIREALNVFKRASRAGYDYPILLKCNTNYPAKIEDQNLLAIKTLNKFVPVVGFSDHTEGSLSGLTAVALGASVIERHFTLDKNDPGPDHKASMEPAEFKKFVQDVRAVEAVLGSAELNPTGGEIENILGMRKSLCASVDISIGTIIGPEMLTAKRPGDGIYAIDFNLSQIIGKRTKREIKADDNVYISDVE
jgi:N,N'-diacetyllegionaminate synthase